MGGMADTLETHPSHTCYMVPNLIAGSNSMGVGMGSQKFWGRWGPPHWKNTTVLHTRYHVEYGRCRSTDKKDTSILTEISIPPFKVTRGHRKRHGSIGYLRLLISDP